MKLFNSKIFKALFLCTGFVFFTSCNTLKQPTNIPEPIDYSDDFMVKNEIDRINNYIVDEPVRALWRALLLGQDDIIDKCVDNLSCLLDKAFNEKNHSLVSKYYKSLESIGRAPDKYSQSEIDTLVNDDIPGLSGHNDKAPKSIEDCINATCTIWVDRGIRVENGAGYADIIIGSGFFIDKRGYLVTNYHVIDSMVNPKYEGFSRLYIKLPSDMDTKIKAKVVGYDKLLDFALLKVEIEPEFVFNLGSSDGLRVGDKISAIGTPIGLEGTLTSGIISSTDRKLLNLGSVFQIDAAVNSGNSGGPLIDQNMNVQAIVFAGMLEFQGLNFAIPVEYLIQELGVMYTQGEVIHPWTGSYGRTKKRGTNKIGLEVQYIIPGGPAAMSGLKAGDIIVEFDGNKVSSLDDFHFLMLGYESETLLKCKYINKEDELKEAFIYLDKRPKAPAVEIYNTDYVTHSFIPLFGMELVSSSTLNKKSFTIVNVLSGSSADELSFSPNDVIEIRDVKFDDEQEAVYIQVYTRRRKKGYLDIVIGMGTPYDGPNYF